MARPTAGAQRSLTLTEELEKLEQSITLTLQEIDQNFSRAHRIVTSSILPIVEQYAEHSREVWEGSKFWKQFFEASANVSLNGYEEAPEDEDQTITTTTNDDDLLSESTPDGRSASSFMETPGQRNSGGPERSESEVSPPPTVTPKAARVTPKAGRTSGDRGSDVPMSPTPSSSTFPSTPRAQTYSTADDSTMEASTPNLPTLPGTSRKTPGSKQQQQHDPLLHRVLDRNYRVQATPMGRGASRHLSASQSAMSTARRDAKLETPASQKTGAFNLDIESSPMEEAPQIRSGLFQGGGGRRVSGQKAEWESQRNKERVPGVSVLGPSKDDGDGDTSRISLSKAARQSLGRGATIGLGGRSAGGGGEGGGGWESDSDEGDAFGGMSPPKTMAFNVPTSKLMRTPAREASKMIVQDLLATAGGENMTEDLEDSPSIIRKEVNYEEDTF